MSVRTNWVDHDFALVNGAPTFLTLADDEPRPHEVVLELPSDWARSVTALPATENGRPDSYWAADFDELLDSPIVVGNPSIYEFSVEGVSHSLVNIGDDGLWEGQRAADDVARIVRQQYELWGFFPYERYLFLNLITESGGGIEHKDSTVLMSSRWDMRDREEYLNWLTLVSHEHFHAWNVKRLRPVELGPFDYENEVHTRQPVGGRGTDRLLRCPDRASSRSLDARRVSGRAVERDPWSADDPWSARPEPGTSVLRRLDQILPPERE